MHNNLLQHEEKSAAGRTSKRERGFQRAAEDREDDVCYNNGIHGVLEPVLRGAAMVRVEPEQRAYERLA